MMALAALSMARSKGSSNVNALEHYQQVIPALQAMVQSSQDSYSDGPFLTHTFLLLYEVCHSYPTSNRAREHQLAGRKQFSFSSGAFVKSASAHYM
jgi:hypothetical protein